MSQVYTTRRFEMQTSWVGRGNYIADVINQFLAYNPTITVVDISINWREGRSRSDTFYLTMLYRGGGSPGRLWCTQFQSDASFSAEDIATTFFASNPTYQPIKTVVLTRPDIQPRTRRLLTIFATRNNAQTACSLITPGGAPPALLAVGGYALFYDTGNLPRPALPAINLGNVAWPAGAMNLLIRGIDASPNMCSWGGIAPGCDPGTAIVTTEAPSADLLCDNCIDPDLVTITFTASP